MENSLAATVNVANSKAYYDENIKNILSDKEVLSWILKNTTSEFSRLTIEEIMECIEGEPEISSVLVNPGETNAVSMEENEKDHKNIVDLRRRITGLKNEDIVPNEGTIAYDIRFYAYVPGKERRIKIILNLEAQKKYNPGYQLVTRGIFYGGRMISAQLDTEFEIPNYDDLKKVYSIWICVEAPQYIGNSISRYSIEKEDIIEGIPDNKSAYDKLSVVMVCLNEKMEKKTEFLELMNVLLSQTMSVKLKKKILEEKFHMNMESRLGEKVNLMCNLSDLVEERGEIKGMLSVFKDMDFTMESAVEHVMSVLEIDSEKVYEIAKVLWEI